MTNEIKNIESRGEGCLLIGDMNWAIGDGRWGIEGNKSNVSYGGLLMRELLETQEYFLLNNLSMVEGWPWTWFSRADSKVKSCLDLAVISRNLLPFVTKVVIDNQREFTPFRVTRKKSLYTEHLSYKVVLRKVKSREKNGILKRLEAGKPIKSVMKHLFLKDN